MAIWHYETRRLGASGVAPGGYAYDYRDYTSSAVVEPTITAVTGTVAPGATITLTLEGFASAPTSVTFGGVAVTVNSATTSSASVTLLTRATLELLWGASYTITASNATPETASTTATLLAPTGWNYIALASVPADTDDSFYRMRRDDSIDPFTASTGDQFQFTTATGFTVDNQTRLFVSEGNYPVSGDYAVYDVSLSNRLAEHDFTIEEPDGIPAAFDFTDVTGATAGSTVTSNTLTLTGFNVPILVSVTGGLISINGGTFTATSSELEPGQTLRLRGTASGSSLGVVNVVVTAGGVSNTWSITTEEFGGGDTTPDAFTFNDVTNATLSTQYTSNTITISGIDSPAPISITGGTYSVNGGSHTSSPGTVENGNTVAVRVTSSASFSTAVNATLTIGAVGDTYTVTTLAEDTTPDAFSFTPVTGATVSTVYTSNTITVAGINTATPISITGGTYSINGAAYASASGTVTNGQTVSVRLTSSGSFSTAASAILTIGGVSGTYTVTTEAADTTPAAFNFTDVTGADISSVVTSNSITPTGYNSAAAISITGGEYSIDAGAFTSSPGTISPGSSVRVRLTSSDSYSTAVNAVLTIGGVSDTFTATTMSEPAQEVSPGRLVSISGNRVSVAIHSGDEAAELDEYMNPNDVDTFWVSWTDKLNGESISTSDWIIPAGFTEEATTSGGEVVESGTTYADANSITLSTSLTRGRYMIRNEITTSGGRTLRRGFIVSIDPTI